MKKRDLALLIALGFMLMPAVYADDLKVANSSANV